MIRHDDGAIISGTRRRAPWTATPTPYYADLNTTALPSARRIVPLLLELIEVKSAVDVGCGNAAWLAVLKEHGVTDVLGIDGAHASRRHLRIPEKKFTAASLEEPLAIDRRFDLAISLEAAERLSPKRAASSVEDLARLAPVVLFSAAIPGQGGVHHVNEQWPHYWTALRLARESAFCRVPATVAWMPREAPGRLSTSQARQLQRVTLATAYFLRDNPETPTSSQRYAYRKAAGRAWKWARRRKGEGLGSRWFWRRVLSGVPLAGDYSRRIERCAAVFDSEEERRASIAES